MNERQTQEPIVPISTILGLDYGTTSYDQRVKARYDYVKKQLELDPEYEGWDYLECLGYEDRTDFYFNPSYLVSNKGNLLNSNGVKLNGTNIRGYRAACFSNKGVEKILRVNRVVATVFMPGGDLHLITNHIDLDKENNKMENLEWITQKDNVIHAHNNGAHKPYVHKLSHYCLTWVLDDEWHNECFYVGTLDDVKLLVNDWSSVRKSMGTSISYGGRWYMSGTKPNLPPLPDFLIRKIKSDKSYLSLKTIPLKVTTPEGNIFTLYGGSEIRGIGLHQSEVHKAMKANKVYRGLLFEEVTRKEANKYPRGKP